MNERVLFEGEFLPDGNAARRICRANVPALARRCLRCVDTLLQKTADRQATDKPAAGGTDEFAEKGKRR